MKKADNTLLAKYFSNECTKQEVEFIEMWKAHNTDEFNEAFKAFNANLFSSNSYSSEDALNNLALTTKTEKISLWNKRPYLMLAASFLGFLIVISGLWYDNSLKHVILNESDGVSLVQLPDESTVKLNQGSSISFKESWFSGFNRRVALEGKAFFKITKNPNQEFTVLTEQLNVTVLGTQFTVNQKGDRTQFILKEGKVKLEGSAIMNELFVDNPGQQIIIENGNIVKNNIIDATLYVSWVNDKIYFDNCSVKKVLQMLNDSYQIETRVSDLQLLDKQILGTAPSDDPELIVDALSHIIESEIEIIKK